jgi:hypothetical protein
VNGELEQDAYGERSEVQPLVVALHPPTPPRSNDGMGSGHHPAGDRSVRGGVHLGPF